MLTQEQRATMSAMWLARWLAWQGAGISMAEYGRREGFDADAAYRWRRVLRRTGQLAVEDAPAESKAAKPKKPAVRFARVALQGTPAPASMSLRLVLANGRRAELEIGGLAQLGAVIGALERSA